MGCTIRENTLDCPHCHHKSDLDYAINIFDRTEDEQERANGKCAGCERRLVFRRTRKGFIKVYKAKSTDPEYGEERVRSGFIEHRIDCPKCGVTNNADDIDKVFSRSNNIDTVSYQCDACRDKLIVRRNANGFYNFYVYYYNYNLKRRR